MVWRGWDFRRSPPKYRRAKITVTMNDFPGHLYFRPAEHRTKRAQRHGNGLLGGLRAGGVRAGLPGLTGEAAAVVIAEPRGHRPGRRFHA